jgi:two-component system, NtrC family, sensor kinase
MQCPRCQHENRPQAKFCEECASSFNGASPTGPSYAELKTEVERIGGALTEALEQQTATSEILRVLSQFPTDVQPVFDTIVESVVRLCDGVFTTVFRFDGDLIHAAAHHQSITPEGTDLFRSVYPMRPSRDSVIARSILDRTVE